MAVKTLQELTWTELGTWAQQGAIAMVAIGPMEDHGPHLPAGVDLYLAQGFVRELGRRVERETGKDIVVLPPIPLGAQAQYTLGCLRLKANSLRSVVRNLGRELAREGFEACVVVTAHGAASHLAALEIACRQASRHGIRMINPSGPLMMKFLTGQMRQPLERSYGRAFTKEEWDELKFDFHAGAWETSMMICWHPDLVGDYKRLPPFSVFRDKMEDNQGYFGSPALSSERLGRTAIEVLGTMGAEYVLKKLGARPSKSHWWLAGALLGGAALAVAAHRRSRVARR